MLGSQTASYLSDSKTRGLFHLILNISCRDCGSTVAHLQVLSLLWDPGWNSTFLWHIAFLVAGEKWLWPRQAMALKTLAQLWHKPLLLTSVAQAGHMAKSKVCGQRGTCLLQEHWSRMGMATDVYYCYRKRNCLVGRSNIIFYSIPLPFYKWVE